MSIRTHTYVRMKRRRQKVTLFRAYGCMHVCMGFHAKKDKNNNNVAESKTHYR